MSQQTTTTTWSFSATREDVDLVRVLREAPSQCRVVRVVVGDQRLLAIRSSEIDRAAKADLAINPPRATSWACHYNPKPKVHPDGGIRMWEGSVAATGWVCSSCSLSEEQEFGSTLEWALDALRAVDAHYAALIRVTVTAA